MYLPVPNIDYRTCKLSEGDEWFIFFYVKNPGTGKLKRIRIKINRIPKIAARRKAAREMMSAIDQRLALGWNPLMEAHAPKCFKDYKTFFTPGIILTSQVRRNETIAVDTPMNMNFPKAPIQRPSVANWMPSIISKWNTYAP